MFELNPEHVRIRQSAVDKASALMQLAAMLEADQLVATGYLDSLQRRESQGSTYLGQGIAIPHGVPETRDMVQATGVRIIHFAEGVDWGDGNRVFLAIAIAAKSDEHLRVLQMLTRALGEEGFEARLQAVLSSDDIVTLLQGAPQALALDEELICLQVDAEDIEDLALRGARALKLMDCVSHGFAANLLAAQPLALGNGIWWLNSDQSVVQPGLAFVTPLHALIYDEQPLRALFCLASQSETHRALLERLCDVLIAGRADELADAVSESAVLSVLGADLAPDWPNVSVVLPNPHGLHARPAKELVQLIKNVHGEIRVRLGAGQPVSAKSLSRLLALGAQRGQTLTFLAEPDTAAVGCLSEIVAAIQSGLGETVEPASISQAVPSVSASHHNRTASDALMSLEDTVPLSDGMRIKAIAAAPGLATAPVHVVLATAFTFDLQGHGLNAEMARLNAARDQVRADIAAMIEHSTQTAVREIFLTHQEMLDDPDVLDRVQQQLRRKASAEAAWQKQIEDSAQRQEALGDPLLAARAADLREVGRRVLAVLCGVASASEPAHPYILAMDEVGPGDVARLDRQRVMGFVTARGGASSHSAIVARELGIPAVAGVGQRLLDLKSGTMLLLDGDSGCIDIAPDTAAINAARTLREYQQKQQAIAFEKRFEPAQTRDGHRVEVAANIGNPEDVSRAVAEGAEAIGLLRTELVFMRHAQQPDEAMQEQDYRAVLDGLAGRPLVVRTLDVGGDKPLPYLPLPSEDNPFLGVRGIWLALRRPELLDTQLGALLRAADGRDLRIMFPMVGRLEEWRSAKAALDRIRMEIPCSRLQAGIMIEVPSAALLAPVLAPEVDFFSIGTNDLTQYTLAIDRGHPLLSGEADGLHPAVLSLIDSTVRAAHHYGKWVGVCGELAADPLAIPVLVGLGVDELSVSARSIPAVKARVRQGELRQWEGLAIQALSLGTADEVRNAVNSAMGHLSEWGATGMETSDARQVQGTGALS